MKKFTTTNPRPQLANLLAGNDQEIFLTEKCWQCVTSNTFEDVVARLKDLQFKILKVFGILKQEAKICTHILALSSHGHQVIIKTEPIACDTIIQMFSTTDAITPATITLHFAQHMQFSHTSYCFLTHQGLDLLSNEPEKYLFTNPIRDLQKLEFGNKFYLILPYVKYENLASLAEANDIYTFLSEATQTRDFSQIACRSDHVNLLTSKGPYTVFAPSNYALQKEYDTTCATDLEHDKCTDVVLRHIFPGVYDNNFSGNVRNLAGSLIEFKEGLPIINGTPIKVISDQYRKANGNIWIINRVMDSVHSDGEVPSFKHEANRSISAAAIAVTTYYAWKAQNLLDLVETKSLREQLQIMLVSLDRHEKQLTELNKDGSKLLALNETFRTALYQANVEVEAEIAQIVPIARKEELEALQTQIIPLSLKYFEHIKSGSKISALAETNMPLTKELRDI
ncbi:MAG: fasciclin domain-containing protein [Candidatus Roizmanbacteria bacterium]